MTQPEAVEAVRDYLAHTGGSEVEQVWNGLERQVTQSQVRAALKSLGAIAWRSVNPWPSMVENVRTTADAKLFTLRKFTLYRLPS